MNKSKTVEEYISKLKHRRDEIEKLRAIFKKFPFEETIKWGMPTYTIGGKNIAGLAAFKDWSCIWFHNGNALSDPGNVLTNAQEGKTQSMRQWRFPTIEAIDEEMVRSYMQEAIANKDVGKKKSIIKRKNNEVPIPVELEQFFHTEPALRKKFNTYTKAQQNAFSGYVAEAKQLHTKISRIEKIATLLDQGKRLEDLWKKK